MCVDLAASVDFLSMFGGQRWRWIVAAAGVVVPLAAVLGSLRYHSGLWPIVFLAVAAAASVLLVEIGSTAKWRSRGARRVSATSDERGGRAAAAATHIRHESAIHS